MLSKGIRDNLFNKIYDKIDAIINRYINDDVVNIYHLKKYYKNKHNIKPLISDIQHEGERLFNNENEYYDFIIEIIKEVFDDRISEYESNKLSESNLYKFNDFIEKKNSNENE